MRFMVTVEASNEAGKKLDHAPGGPGDFFALVGERYRPEAFYVFADRRAATWILDLPDAAAVAELYHLMVTWAGNGPQLQPVLTGPEAAKAIPAAVARAKQS